MLPSVQSWALVASCPDCFSWWKHCSWYDPSDQRLPSASPTAFNTPHSSTPTAFNASHSGTRDTVLQTSGFLRLQRQPSTKYRRVESKPSITFYICYASYQTKCIQSARLCQSTLHLAQIDNFTNSIIHKIKKFLLIIQHSAGPSAYWY